MQETLIGIHVYCDEDDFIRATDDSEEEIHEKDEFRNR